MSSSDVSQAQPASSPAASARPLRVLLISHTCQVPAEGQPKSECLAQMPGITLRVLIPDRWCHYGIWRKASITPQPKADYQIGRVRLPWVAHQFYFHFYAGLKKILLDFRPDVIDLWEEPWAFVSAQTVRLRNRYLHGVPIVSETEQNIEKTLPPPFEQIRRYTLRNSAYVVGRNQEALDVVRRKGYAGPSAVVPNAVDAELFHPMNKSQCRAKLGLSGFVIGYAGRMIEEKGLADILRALPQCPQQVSALFIGDGPFLPALHELADKLQIQSRVRFMPGVKLEELPPLFNALNCFVLPSRTTARWKEQFGRVIIEAHACEVPVIGSSSGAIPEVIGNAGLVFPEGDISALAAAITQLASDPAAAEQLGRIGRQNALARYTWQRVAERMYEIYQDAAHRAR